jgi:hypothetical protein
MREIPILMSGPLVRATLAGQKTQTRRPIKRENKPDPGFEWAECLCREIDPSDTPCATCAARFPGLAAAGDRLWVRETWDWRDWQSMANRKVRIAYAADGAQVDTIAPCDWNPVVYNAARWHPMPRWACRLVLPLVSVRVERVQAISEADAWAEGYGEHWQRRVKEAGADGPLGRPSPQAWFATLWDKLYGTWGQNPWVAVYEWGTIEVAK